MLQPRDPQPAAQVRALYESQLGEIDRIVGWVARRTCLTRDDADDFRSWVHLKLIDKDYGVLRSHSGRSSLATYLTAVVQNLARDFAARRWGRWRPSVAAERLGVTAIRLETLLYRDGFSQDVAAEMLRRHHGVRMTALEVSGLAAKLPRREKLSFEAGERVELAPGPERADQQAERSEGETRLEETRSALNDCLDELEVEDRLILRLHYESGLTIAAIAASLDLAPRQLYTRRDRSLRSLRQCMQSRGLEGPEVLEALQWSTGDEVFSGDSREAEDSGPSNRTTEDHLE